MPRGQRSAKHEYHPNLGRRAPTLGSLPQKAAVLGHIRSRQARKVVVGCDRVGFLVMISGLV